MNNSNQLSQDFLMLSHEEKYQKLLVYVTIIASENEKFIWLQFVLEEVYDSITDEDIIELYNSFLILMNIDDENKRMAYIKTMQEQLQSIKEREGKEEKDKESDLENLLWSI